MINRLFIKDFAIICELDLPLKNGLTVITGETGAGKTILLKALEIALGGKAEKTDVRSGQNQAVVEATNAGIPVIGVSNTDNLTSKLDLVIPANNRGRKALATVYWLLAREILIQKGELTEDQDMKYEIDDFETKIKDIEEDESY